MPGKPVLVLAIVGMLALPLIIAVSPTLSAEAASSTADKNAPGEAQKPAVANEGKKEIPTEKFSITHHSITVDGKTLRYTATAGTMQMKDESGKVKASLFFTAYAAEKQKHEPERPVTFAFNGGPGAASLWLHLAALGPKRVLTDEKGALPPPYKLASNEYTWLGFTDLVFIDPVGTGYSRAAAGVDPKEFYGVKKDIEATGDFIRLYCTRYGRWMAPKFIAGESYGTTRAAGLSGYLQDKLGMHLDGVILISSALDFQTISFAPGNDLSYVLYLPAYANAAWYHKKLSPTLQADPIKTRGDVEQFALNEYLVALAKGNSLTDAEREKIVDRLAAYTSLSKLYIRNANMRVSRDGFIKELLRDEHRRIGLLDSRITGAYRFERLMDDPSMFNIMGPLVAAWNDYARQELKYESDITYEFLSEKANEWWNWGSAAHGYVNVADTLAHAMGRSTFLRIFIASGYYDLDTSYFGAQYTVNHLGEDPKLRDRVTMAYYHAGHQMYTHMPSLRKLREDVAGFFKTALPGEKR
jgi:carboxypeptidase C (cathepsin A)